MAKAKIRALFLLALADCWLPQPAARAQSGEMVSLADGWQIQSAQSLRADGSCVASLQCPAAGWQSAAVPTTVFAALANDGVYSNLFFGTNLANVSSAPFAGPWWFRREIRLNPIPAANQAELIFEGINYRANVWLNGRQVAGTNEIFGAYRIFHLDCGADLKAGTNVLAVEVFPPRPGDFTVGFVDWNPPVPDREMGLFRPVKLHFYQSVAIDHAFVESKIDHGDWQKAALTIHADLRNHSDRDATASVRGEIGPVSFSKTFHLGAGEKRSVALTSADLPQLNFAHAKLWWPWELGEPHLYHLRLSASVAGEISDQAQTDFGIREVSDYLTPEGYRGYAINGQRILIRGGGWSDELLLRENETNLEAQIRYARAMNLNTIRLEGFWGSSQQFYDLADRCGLLVMAGFSCQWEWQEHLGKECDDFGGLKSEADLQLAAGYLRDQVQWLRNHPSIFVWVLGSDKLPRPALEARYDGLLSEIDPTRPKLKTCDDRISRLSGPSGVKMNGPYDYVTPNYWYLDTTHGGAFGFNTETGPGPQPPPLESLQRMIPSDHLWPIDEVWRYHCARGEFAQMDRYFTAFTNRYGPVASAEEFAFKSQAANYEAIRPMYEAFAANLPHTTGIIQWMLNAAWPKLCWQLYDYNLVPGGAFFGAQRGAAPSAVIYNYGNQGIYLVNQSKDTREMRTTVTVYDANSQIILSTNVISRSVVYGSKKIFDLSGLQPATPVYFLDLATRNAKEREVARNFYWLSTKPDVLDEEKSKWFVTPNQSFSDFTGLNRLPEATVKTTLKLEPAGGETRAVVTLTNEGDRLAFFIEMRLLDPKSQASLTPVFWEDNYVSLPPHSSKSYSAILPKRAARPELKLRGWNVKFE